MVNLLSLETSKYNIKLENFEGPLDLFVAFSNAKSNGHIWYQFKQNNRSILRLY